MKHWKTHAHQQLDETRNKFNSQEFLRIAWIDLDYCFCNKRPIFAIISPEIYEIKLINISSFKTHAEVIEKEKKPHRKSKKTDEMKSAPF